MPFERLRKAPPPGAIRARARQACAAERRLGGGIEPRHTIPASRWRVSVHTLPRLSRRAGFWAVAFSFLVVAAFSTAPSSLYGLYEHREHLSSLTITFVYAVYAVGVVASLLLAGHVSDWYGRRVVLIPAIAVAAVATAVF